MREYYPLLVVGAVIGTLSVLFVLAYVFMKNKKEAEVVWKMFCETGNPAYYSLYKRLQSLEEWTESY